MTAIRTILVLSLILTVGIASSWAKSEPPIERPKNINVVIIGFVVGTSMQLRAEFIAEALRNEYPDWTIKSLATPKGSMDVRRHRQKKTANFFLTLSPWKCGREYHMPVYRDAGIDYDKVFNHFPVIPTDTKTVHFFVLNESKLASIRDLKNIKYPLKIGYDKTHHLLFNRIIKFYGTTWEDIKSWGGDYIEVNFGAPMGPEMMRAGKINAGFGWTGAPNPAFLSVGKELDWRLLPIAEPGEDELLKNVKEVGFYGTVISPGVYPWVKNDLYTIAQTEWLSAIPDTNPEGVVYWVTRGLWNQRNFLISGFKGFAPKLKPSAIASDLEFLTTSAHPEALLFYREQGWIK